MKKILFILLILSSSSGLVFAQNTEFITYRGPQQVRLGDPLGMKVDQKGFALPVYYGYPMRSYRIIGAVVAHGPSVRNDDVPPDKAVRSIVSTAKLHGAEAVIMVRLTNADRAANDPDGGMWIVAKAVAISWRRPNDS